MLCAFIYRLSADSPLYILADYINTHIICGTITVHFHEKIIFMYAVGICNPTRRIADWSSPLLGTYPLVRKGPRPEVSTSLTLLAIGSGDMGYSGYKVRNSANDCSVPVPLSFALQWSVVISPSM